MEQGLRLLIQLVLEFAPVVVNLVQKRTEEGLATTTYQFPKVIEEVLEFVSITTNNKNAEEEFQQEKNLQKQLAVYHRETQLQVAQQQRDTSLQLPEMNKVLDSWPLRLYPSQILGNHHHKHTPLKIFLAPPQIKFDQFESNHEEVSEIERTLAEGLREFINTNYSLHDPLRPTEFLAGAWDSKRFHSESSIKALFSMLKTEPILVLESEHDGDYLNFRIAYWGLGQENYFYKTISRLAYKDIIQEFAKSRALEWKKTRDELVTIGEDIEEINQLGGDNIQNLAILEKLEKWQSKGIDTSKLSLKYQINHQDIAKFSQVLITCHCLVAAWVVDAYHLVHHDVQPLLPQLLPSLLKDTRLSDTQTMADDNLLRVYATGYQQVYQALEKERRYWVPELALQLAQSLTHLSDRTWAQEQVDYSITTWLELRQVTTGEFLHPLQAMQSAIKIEDQEYIYKLKEYFTAVGDRQNSAAVDQLLAAIANLKHKRTLESPELIHTLTGHSGKVTSVAISPNSEILVSGCADQTINIWNLPSGKHIRTLTSNLGEVSSVAISPDGNFLAVGSCQHPRSNVTVWSLKTGQLIHTLLGHQKPVNVVNISPDGQILATGSNKIKIWNLHKGDRICTLWHSAAVHAVAISPDGSILASGSSDSKIRLWNPRNGDPICTLAGHTGEVQSIAISPDGQLLFSGSADTTIKIWHLITGKLLHTLNGHSDAVKSIAISPNGELLFSGSGDRTINIWRISTNEILYTLTGHSGTISSLALSPDGKFLVSASSDKKIKIWQVVTS
ncbi:WD40 repeat domain-containing protein [Nostoc sp. FACHB-152]|uniref:WD40 repeat domain-containing protein n=1 Tax=unclassified Nostoc TaxID=2593658 RepID=UPI0016830DD5|nr:MULTISPECIES: WD40 repeat domain-containing protein [unclassified Nostoc]MBD2449564.1 WD40 repeat domain-containing protein [Nostoc sp. FACHB-152]MBD2470887.1 WD40 repeat domain-containing protein [Nostoc sp. FACHB-145]